jgi:LmbE family N-acetylglucosaminyl deacetylase
MRMIADDEQIDRHLKSLRINKEKTTILASSKRIISFSPHPDDSEIVAGGFLASAVERGADVKVVVVSDDRMSLTSMSKPLPMEEIVALRKREELEALGVLGIKNLEFLEYADSEVPEPRALSRDFIRIMRSFQPDLAVTVDPLLPYEAHPDHINTGRGVMQAIQFHAYPYIVRDAKVSSGAPVLALGASAIPNAVVPIDHTVNRKVKAILAHKSQWPDPKKMEETIRRLSAGYGRLAGCSYGEAFKVLLPDELHVDPFASQ